MLCSRTRREQLAQRRPIPNRGVPTAPSVLWLPKQRTESTTGPPWSETFEETAICAADQRAPEQQAHLRAELASHRCRDMTEAIGKAVRVRGRQEWRRSGRCARGALLDDGKGIHPCPQPMHGLRYAVGHPWDRGQDCPRSQHGGLDAAGLLNAGRAQVLASEYESL